MKRRSSRKPLRLGEVFVQKKLISPRQLEEALKGQLIYGGHLGTCLLEMGCVDERALGEVLAEVFGVRYASPDLFEDIPSAVLRSIPAKLVERHQAVPIDMENTVLQVAMINPKNLQAVDELSFAAGRNIEPWVAPEARIFQAMERFYDIPRRQRYITICREMDSMLKRSRSASGRKDRRSRSRTYGDPPYLRKPSTPETEGVGVRKESSVMIGSPEQEDPTIASIHPALVPPAMGPDTGLSTPALGGMAVGAPVSMDGVASPSGGLSTVAPEQAPVISQAATPEMLEEEFSTRLCNAESLEDLAGPALSYAGRGMERCALFAVTASTAKLWGSKGIQLTEDAARGLSLKVPSDPLFELLLGQDYYRGPVPKNSGLRKFCANLDLGFPSDTLVMPGYLDDRLLVLMYGDGGSDGRIRGETERYRRLIRKLALALKLVLLKKRIRTA